MRYDQSRDAGIDDNRYDESRAGSRGYGGSYGEARRGAHGTWDIYAVSWWVPGEHSGRGPKNYTRSDERIREDVSERLEQSGQIDADEIEVQVQDGIVTLRGTVPNRQMKRMAEDAAESCSGVTDIHNELRLEEHDHDGERRRSDDADASGSRSTDRRKREMAASGSR